MRRLKESLRNASPRTKRNFNFAVQEVRRLKGGQKQQYYLCVEAINNPYPYNIIEEIAEGTKGLKLWRSKDPYTIIKPPYRISDKPRDISIQIQNVNDNKHIFNVKESELHTFADIIEIQQKFKEKAAEEKAAEAQKAAQKAAAAQKATEVTKQREPKKSCVLL